MQRRGRGEEEEEEEEEGGVGSQTLTHKLSETLSAPTRQQYRSPPKMEIKCLFDFSSKAIFKTECFWQGVCGGGQLSL